MIEIIIGLLLLTATNDLDKSKDLERIITDSNNIFSFKVFKMLSKSNNNDVMSSLSILSAFSVLMNGAKDETLSDLKEFLEYDGLVEEYDPDIINEGFRRIGQKYNSDVTSQSMQTESYESSSRHILKIANLVVYNQKIQLLPEFKKVVEQYYRAQVQKVDIDSKAIEETHKVNEWVRNQTNNKIQSIIDKLEPNTIALIVNAVYFKGIWEKTFKKHLTSKMDFYNNGINAAKVDTMTRADNFNYAESLELDSTILEMGYRGGELSFVIVLPKDINGLEALKERINAHNFQRAVKSMKYKNIKVFIPKFKVENSYDLMKEIKPKPIALTSHADLSGIASGPLKVTDVKHKVFIEVNEEGTEAAAVTAIVVTRFISVFQPQEPIEFKADHPFLYFIRDKTNSMILFSGQINKL